jgi:16S rRNA (guanine527-N7)-methyltransferase
MDDILKLGSVFRKNALRCTEDELRKLLDYSSLILEWNKKINLVSRRDEENFLERHIIASIALLFKFDVHPGTSVLDLGTGGGLPGIPLSILRRDNSFTLVDSIRKKTAAVQDMVDRLALNNVAVRLGRAEEISGGAGLHHAFHYIVSRAVSSITDIVRWSKPFLITAEGRAGHLPAATDTLQMIPPGSIILYKGGDLSQEVREAERKTDGASISIHPLTVEGIAQEHIHDKKIVIIQP